MFSARKPYRYAIYPAHYRNKSILICTYTSNPIPTDWILILHHIITLSLTIITVNRNVRWRIVDSLFSINSPPNISYHDWYCAEQMAKEFVFFNAILVTARRRPTRFARVHSDAIVTMTSVKSLTSDVSELRIDLMADSNPLQVEHVQLHIRIYWIKTDSNYVNTW